MADRPLGIAILAILGIIGGILFLLIGLAAIGIGALAGVAYLSDPSVIPIPAALLSVLASVIGIVIIIVAIIILIVSRGLWVGSNWARILMLILLILGALGNIWTLIQAMAIVVSPLVSLIISLLFIYYLTRSHVVNFFT